MQFKKRYYKEQFTKNKYTLFFMFKDLQSQKQKNHPFKNS